MTDDLTLPLQEFHDDLNRLEQLLGFLLLLRNFGSVSTTPSEEASESGLVQGAISIRSAVRDHREDLSILSGTLLMYLAGRFEHFVRVSFENLCGVYAGKCDKFDQLPEKMKSSLIIMTAEVIQRPSKYGFDDVQARGFLHTLSNNINAVSGLGDINASVISLAEAMGLTA